MAQTDSTSESEWVKEFREKSNYTFFKFFVILDESKLIKNDKDLKIIEPDNFITEIGDSKIDTGIMISYLKKNYTIYLFILDDKIFIVPQNNLSKYKKYFDEKSKSESLLFFSKECERDFKKEIMKKEQNPDQVDNILKKDQNTNQIDYNEIIKNELIKAMIKKIQIRMLHIHQHPLPDSFNIEKKYEYESFIEFQTIKNGKICYNVQDQILNFLKYNDNKNIKKDHEKDCYKKINNSFPFICKVFGITNHFYDEYFVLEYIEGETLYNFIEKHKNIDLATKIKISLEILFSVHYINSNGIILRDLNSLNIIVDPENNAYLIDFNQTKNVESGSFSFNNGLEMYVAPEIFGTNNSSNKISTKSDCFSIGMIINYIFTGEEYRYTDYLENYDTCSNISDFPNFPKFPDEYKFIFDVIRNCFEKDPESRYDIEKLYMGLIFNNNYKEQEKLIKTIVHEIMTKFQNFQTKTKFDIIPHISFLYYNRSKMTQTDSTPENQWKEKFRENSKNTFFDNFDIFDESNLIKNDNDLKIIEPDNFITEIGNSKIDTGIMISYLKKNYTIYLFILDDKIFIVPQNNLSKYKKYFDEKSKSKSLLFFSKECERDFKKEIMKKEQNPDQVDNILKKDQNTNQIDYNEIIKNELIKAMIKKIQIRMLHIRQHTFNIEKDFKYDKRFTELCTINNSKICYNVQDQILIFLKYNKEEKEKANEYDFYKIINNGFPFICKAYGITYIENDEYLVLEYIEGETLNDFIKNHQNIDLETKLRISLEILFSVHYINLNRIVLRNLNIFNIIIDSEKNVCLVDFNQTEQVNESGKLDYFTQNIGIPMCIAPEIYNNKNDKDDKNDYSNDISTKIDCFSIGMIINYIFTEKEYYYINGLEKYKDYGNISNFPDFPKFPDEYKFIFDVIQNCFEKNPKLRYDIEKNYMGLIFNNNYKEPEKLVKAIIPKLMELFQSFQEKIKLDIVPYISSLYYNRAKIFYEGEAVNKNNHEAIKNLNHSSNKNNPHAQFLLGKIYLDGNNHVTRDVDKAIEKFTFAANNKHYLANFYLGLIYYEDEYRRKDIKKAIYYFELAANQNDPNAQFYLGKIYYRGDGVGEDIKKAIHYFKLAAEQKDTASLQNLGYIYYYGIGVEAKKDKAIEYYERASNLGNQYAQLFIGTHYYKEGNINKALDFIKRSADQNNEKALFRLGFMLQEKGDDNSIFYYKKATNYNGIYAFNNLGIIYKHGINVQANINESVNWFNEAIKLKNDRVSMYNLAHTFFFYNNNTKTNDEIIKLLIDSADHGFTPSIQLLCLILLKKRLINQAREIFRSQNANNAEELYQSILRVIYAKQLTTPERIEDFYNECKSIDYIYDFLNSLIESKKMINNQNNEPTENQTPENTLSSEFIEAFNE